MQKDKATNLKISTHIAFSSEKRRSIKLLSTYWVEHTSEKRQDGERCVWWRLGG